MGGEHSASWGQPGGGTCTAPGLRRVAAGLVPPRQKCGKGCAKGIPRGVHRRLQRASKSRPRALPCGSVAFPGDSGTGRSGGYRCLGLCAGHRSVRDTSPLQLKTGDNPQLVCAGPAPSPVPLVSPASPAHSRGPRPQPCMYVSIGKHLDFIPALLHIFKCDFITNI